MSRRQQERERCGAFETAPPYAQCVLENDHEGPHQLEEVAPSAPAPGEERAAADEYDTDDVKNVRYLDTPAPGATGEALDEAMVLLRRGAEGNGARLDARECRALLAAAPVAHARDEAVPDGWYLVCRACDHSGNVHDAEGCMAKGCTCTRALRAASAPEATPRASGEVKP